MQEFRPGYENKVVWGEIVFIAVFEDNNVAFRDGSVDRFPDMDVFVLVPGIPAEIGIFFLDFDQYIAVFAVDTLVAERVQICRNVAFLKTARIRLYETLSTIVPRYMAFLKSPCPAGPNLMIINERFDHALFFRRSELFIERGCQFRHGHYFISIPDKMLLFGRVSLTSSHCIL